MSKFITVELLRRILIGVGMGVILIIPLSFILGSSQKITHDMVFDSDLIILPQIIHKKKTEHHDLIPAIRNNDDGSAYAHFAKNRAPLNTPQADAIANVTPVLSIILSAIGGNHDDNDLIASTMPNDVTLSMSPYAHNHNDVASMFGDHGFELWMDMATVTLDLNYDHGDQALSPTYNFEKNIEMLSDQLNGKAHIAGVLLPQRSLINETPDMWQDIVNDLYAQGYGIIDNTRRISKPSLFFYNDTKAPYIKSDQTLDANLSLDEFGKALNFIKEKTLEQKSMIVTIPMGTPASMDVLTQWLKSLKHDNINLVPVSAQAKL